MMFKVRYQISEIEADTYREAVEVALGFIGQGLECFDVMNLETGESVMVDVSMQPGKDDVTNRKKWLLRD